MTEASPGPARPVIVDAPTTTLPLPLVAPRSKTFSELVVPVVPRSTLRLAAWSQFRLVVTEVLPTVAVLLPSPRLTAMLV